MCAAQLKKVDDTQFLDLALAASNCFHAESRELRHLTDSNALLHQLVSKVGLEAQSLLELAQQVEVASLLQLNTRNAVRKGAVGSPTAFVFVAERRGKGGESERMFSGSDQMEQLAHHLSLPYDGAWPKLQD